MPSLQLVLLGERGLSLAETFPANRKEGRPAALSREGPWSLPVSQKRPFPLLLTTGEKVSELVSELALQGPSPGPSTWSCVALGESRDLSGPEFPRQEKGGFYPYCSHCFLVRIKRDN